MNDLSRAHDQRPLAADRDQIDNLIGAANHQGRIRAMRRALEPAWEAIAARPDWHLDMALEPGDLQLCSNHTIAHARRGYVDDPASPRHLVRLWVTL